MGCQIEILFPLADIKDTPQQAVFVDGLANQSWCDLNGSGGTFAAGARPHQIGTDTFLPSPPPPPPPPPAPVPIAPECLAGFDWGSTAVNIEDFAYQGQNNQADKFGNFIVQSHSKTKIFDPTGNVISSMNCNDLADKVDTWFGSVIVKRWTGFSGTASFAATPILQGQYILAVFMAGFPVSFSHWAVILEPSATGDPTVLGAVYYEAFLGPPYLAYFHIVGLANTQTIDDPILIRGANGLGGFTWELALLPSINEIISGTYKFGWTGMADCQVPLTTYYPIGNANLSLNLVVETLTGANGNLKSGFTLPGSGGGTNVYFYFSRSYMDFNALGGGNSDPEVHNVLQPAYPNGCMIKISMGSLNFHDAATHARASGASNAAGSYLVDNANWNDGSAALIPFEDEYHFLSSGAAGGRDTYTMQPGAVIDRGGGKWWIIWYMPGCGDAEVNTAGTLWEKIRIFEYTASSEDAVQIIQHVCINYTFDDIPHIFGSVGDNAQAFSISEAAGVVTVRINGIRNDPATGRVYQTEFFRFSP